MKLAKETQLIDKDHAACKGSTSIHTDGGAMTVRRQRDHGRERVVVVRVLRVRMTDGA